MKFESVEQAKSYLLDKMGAEPEIAIVEGSGLSAVDEILSGPQRTHYVSIPHFPVPKVAGHRGQVVFGKVGIFRLSSSKDAFTITRATRWRKSRSARESSAAWVRRP